MIRIKNGEILVIKNGKVISKVSKSKTTSTNKDCKKNENKRNCY